MYFFYNWNSGRYKWILNTVLNTMTIWLILKVIVYCFSEPWIYSFIHVLDNYYTTFSCLLNTYSVTVLKGFRGELFAVYCYITCADNYFCVFWVLHGNYMSIVHAYLCMMIHNCCHLDISLNKLALLCGEAQLCLPYISL